MADYFTQAASASYDEKNKKLAAIADNLHFLLRLVLNDLPIRAHVLCVGVGTGAEILSLARAYPEWTFTGIDPAPAMLDVCRARLRDAGVAERCELITGYAHDLPAGERFDASLAILVGHFVGRSERAGFYRAMQERLKPGGCLVTAEISADTAAPHFPALLENWAKVQTLMGASPASLATLEDTLKNTLCVLPPAEVEGLLRDAGIAVPVRFFQSFMIMGWHGKKA